MAIRLGTRLNSFGQWQQQPEFAEPPLSIEGAADHWNHRADEDYYTQPGLLFRLMTRTKRNCFLPTQLAQSLTHQRG